jgi:DNA-binding NarL/FixJ family response regulator
MIDVLLADDQALVRAGFRALLRPQPDMQVVGDAEDGAAAVRLARDIHPDVVLMDIRMPGHDGLAATRDIATDPKLSGVRVIVLTTFTDDSYVFDAVRFGASGFLVKDIEPADLIHAIRVVHRGDALLAPAVTRTLIEEFAVRAKPALADRKLMALFRTLTEREREIVTHVAAGLSNDEIAERLFVSPATAKTHVSRAMIKLGARDRAQLVVLAYESGLVRPGWAG